MRRRVLARADAADDDAAETSSDCPHAHGIEVPDDTFATRCLRPLDPRSVFAFRLGLAAVIFWDAYDKAMLVPAFYEGSYSSYPTFAFEEDVGWLAARLNLFTLFHGPAWPSLLLALTAACALGLPWWRSCSVICWCLVTMSTLRNVEVTFIFDRYIHFMLFFSSCLPYHLAQCSRGNSDLVGLLLRLQLAWIYTDAGYGKVMDESKDWTLEAEMPALAVYMQGAPGADQLLQLDKEHFAGWGVRILTALVAWAELLVGPLMLVTSITLPSTCVWIQLLPMAMVWLLHLGIALGMEGGWSIGAIACVSWLALRPRTVWERTEDSAAVQHGASYEHDKVQSAAWSSQFSTPARVAVIFVVSCCLFEMSGVKTRPGPVPTVLLLNRWRVFTGADRSLNWEVAPARLTNGSIIDIWSWQQQINFEKPSYGRKGRWMSFPFTKPASALALDARFAYLCNEWNAVHEAQVEKFQLFELWAFFYNNMTLGPPTKKLLRVQRCAGQGRTVLGEATSQGANATRG
eukprot:gb/GFBE01017011.1/.p1 GENE.gb/GFBE01017011.1/~~gb/GFBE01017011.1/.p1  ORF type:complete len:517 (+),score=79.39 gb/GFBE01017011.1/:1-1551(+)